MISWLWYSVFTLISCIAPIQLPSVSIHCAMSDSFIRKLWSIGLKIFTSVVLRPHCAVSSCQTSDVCFTHSSTVRDLNLPLTITQPGQSSLSLLVPPSKHTSCRKTLTNGWTHDLYCVRKQLGWNGNCCHQHGIQKLKAFSYNTASVPVASWVYLVEA